MIDKLLPSAKEAAEKLPSDQWKSDVTAIAYRTIQNRIVVSVETNASMEGLAFSGNAEDMDRSSAEFLEDLKPIFDRLAPHDEALLAEALLRRLIQWETGGDLGPANRVSIKREPIATRLIEQMRIEASQATNSL